jgi:hypothetical protein
MSTNLSSKAGSWLSAPTQGVNRVLSGSRVKLLLLCETNRNNVPGTARSLLKRHLPIRAAKSAAERLFDEGRAVVELPVVESLEALGSELAACQVGVYKLKQ